MKPFKIIQGNSNNISKFEEEISQAIEDGYEFSSDLISHLITTNNTPEIWFYQPMSIEEHLEFENEDLDYNDNDDEIE